MGWSQLGSLATGSACLGQEQQACAEQTGYMDRNMPARQIQAVGLCWVGQGLAACM